jgi:aminoglycoside phosphotransferase (APT) family kinase protein
MKRSAVDIGKVAGALERWLPERLQVAGRLEVSGFTSPSGSGAANETLLFNASWTEDGRRRRRRLVLRLSTSNPLHPVPLEIHYRMYAALGGHSDIPVPEVLAYEADEGVLGAPFFVMERVEGRVPPDDPPYTAGGWVAEATPSERRQLWRHAVELMARLHQVDPDVVSFLGREDASSGLEGALDFWTEYCDVTTRGAGHAVLDAALEWLRAQLPARRPTSLAWGDARIGNMVFRQFRPVAVLDWDMVSLAGGESDVAWWVLREHAVADLLPGIGTAQETVDLWERSVGRPLTHLRYHLVFAGLRLGAIRLRLARMHPGVELGPGLSTDDNGGIRQLARLLEVSWPGAETASLPRVRLTP